MHKFIFVILEIRINENASYRAQLGALQETLNHLTAEHTVAQNDLAAKTEGLDDFKSKYLSLKNEHGALASSHENMVADLGEKTTKLEKQQDTINALLVKQNEYIVNLEAAKEDVNSFNSAASNSKDKEIAKVYNAQILSLQDCSPGSLVHFAGAPISHPICRALPQALLSGAEHICPSRLGTGGHLLLFD